MKKLSCALFFLPLVLWYEEQEGGKERERVGRCKMQCLVVREEERQVAEVEVRQVLQVQWLVGRVGGPGWSASKRVGRARWEKRKARWPVLSKAKLGTLDAAASEMDPGWAGSGLLRRLACCWFNVQSRVSKVGMTDGAPSNVSKYLEG